MERPVQGSGAGDLELIELTARDHAADVDVEGSRRLLRVVAGDGEDAGAAQGDAGADEAGAGDVAAEGAGPREGAALAVAQAGGRERAAGADRHAAGVAERPRGSSKVPA